MTLDKLILIIVCVLWGAGAVLWAVSTLFLTTSLHPVVGLVTLAIFGLIFYIFWRIISDRLNNPDEDHYDKMEY